MVVGRREAVARVVEDGLLAQGAQGVYAAWYVDLFAGTDVN